jgi:transposase-like protein
MNKKKLTKTTKKSYSPFEKRKIVEEVRSGFYSFTQAREKYILSKTKFRKWNRWYFKIRLLRHFKAKPLPMKKTTNQEVEQLKKQLLEAQALNEKLQLKNRALETMVTIAEKELNIDIRKKSGTKQSKK